MDSRISFYPNHIAGVLDIKLPGGEWIRVELSRVLDNLYKTKLTPSVLREIVQCMCRGIIPGYSDDDATELLLNDNMSPPPF